MTAAPAGAQWLPRPQVAGNSVMEYVMKLDGPPGHRVGIPIPDGNRLLACYPLGCVVAVIFAALGYAIFPMVRMQKPDERTPGL